MKELDDLSWVRLAASTDAARSALCGYHVTETRMVTSDAYRIHWAPKPPSLQVGLYSFAGDEIDSTFPNVAQLTPKEVATFRVVDAEWAYPVATAALAARKITGRDEVRTCVSLRAENEQYAYIRAQLMVDALVGGYRKYSGWAEIALYVPDPTRSLRMDIGGPDGRQAVLMPFRCSSHDQPGRFDVSEFIREVAP